MSQKCQITPYQKKYRQQLIKFTNSRLPTYQFLQSHYQLRRASIANIIDAMDFQPKFLILAIQQEKIVGYISINTRSTLPFHSIAEHVTINTIIIEKDNFVVIQALLHYIKQINDQWQYSQIMMVTGPAWGIELQQIVPTAFVPLDSSYFLLRFDLTQEYQLDQQLATSIAKFQTYKQFPANIDEIELNKQELQTLQYRLAHLDQYGVISCELEGTTVAIMIFIIEEEDLRILQILAEQQLNRQVVVENMLHTAITHGQDNQLKKLLLPDIFKDSFSQSLQNRGAQRIDGLRIYILNDSGYRANLSDITRRI